MITQREIDAFAFLVRKKSVDGIVIDGITFKRKRLGDQLVLASSDDVFKELVFTKGGEE